MSSRSLSGLFDCAQWTHTSLLDSGMGTIRESALEDDATSEIPRLLCKFDLTSSSIFCCNLQDPQKLVDAGALDTLPINLDHASQRLVVELLCCTRDLSDISTVNIDISALLSRLVQLLGKSTFCAPLFACPLTAYSLAHFSRRLSPVSHPAAALERTNQQQQKDVRRTPIHRVATRQASELQKHSLMKCNKVRSVESPWTSG